MLPFHLLLHFQKTSTHRKIHNSIELKPAAIKLSLQINHIKSHLQLPLYQTPSKVFPQTKLTENNEVCRADISSMSDIFYFCSDWIAHAKV